MNSLPPITIPSTPDPTQVALWTGQIRLLISVFVGLGLGSAWLPHITDAQISAELTAVLTVASLIGAVGASAWSFYKEHWAAQHTHAVAQVSAAAGVPVQPR